MSEQIALPEPDPWEERLGVLGRGLHDALIAHPAVARLLVADTANPRSVGARRTHRRLVRTHRRATRGPNLAHVHPAMHDTECAPDFADEFAAFIRARHSEPTN